MEGVQYDGDVVLRGDSRGRWTGLNHWLGCVVTAVTRNEFQFCNFLQGRPEMCHGCIVYVFHFFIKIYLA